MPLVVAVVAVAGFCVYRLRKRLPAGHRRKRLLGAVNAPTDALIAASAPAYSFAPAFRARTNWSWKVAACALTA